MKVACYWGRFNPPHKGHMKVIKNILKKVDKIEIVIGAKEKKDTKRNPFSGEERVKMMKAYLKEERIPVQRARVITIPDGKTWEEARQMLLKKCPKANIIFTDKKRVINTLGKVLEVRKIRRTGNISSTRIRNAIKKDKKWKHLTGRSVAKIIEDKKWVERIKSAK